MSKQRPERSKKMTAQSSGWPTATRLEPVGKVVVVHHTAPPKGPASKQIHPRHPLPVVASTPASGPKKTTRKNG